MVETWQESIKNPSMARLLIEISRNALHAVVMSKSAGYKLAYKHIPLTDSDSDDSFVQALETLIFDTPELTADFNKVDIVLDTDRVLVLPQSEADDDKLVRIFESLWPDNDLEIIVTEADSPTTRVACAVPRRLAGFFATHLSRSPHCPPPAPPLPIFRSGQPHAQHRQNTHTLARLAHGRHRLSGR